MSALDAALDDTAPEHRLRAAETAVAPPHDAPPRVWQALPARPDAPRDRTAATARLLDWARAAGVWWDGIAFRVEPAGATARATRDLAAGERIFALPRRRMIADHELATSTTGQPDVATPADALAAWLALEARAPASPWRAYLDALPTRLDELPMFCLDPAGLDGTAAWAEVAAHNREVRDAYAALAPTLRAQLDLADFAWGHGLVRSRAFHLPGTFDHRLAMMPVLDLFNHGAGDTTWTYDPRDGYVITTLRPIAAGDEVSNGYGARSNSHLLAHYGFVLPGNPVAEAELVFAPTGDPVHAAAAHLLWQLPAAARITVGIAFDHRLQRALSLARLRVSGPADRAHAIELGLSPDGDLPWLGPALEHAALDDLANVASHARARLDGPVPADPRFAVVRDDERAVLDHVIAFARDAQRHLHDATAATLLRDYLASITS